MIISGGENIYPSEVEAVLGAHPQVKDVAVIGLPHDKWGEAVHAVVVLHQPSVTAMETPSQAAIDADTARHAQALTQEQLTQDLLDWCRGRIAGYKRPQAIHILDDAQMPRTATGKILHRLLRQQIATPD